MQPTSLVHEAWIRLGGGAFENRSHFFSAAAEAMRRILVEGARRKMAEKRGGGEAEHLPIDEVEIIGMAVKEEETLAVHEALDALASEHPRKAELVKLRYFVGLSMDEIADVLGISVATAHREWAFARVWLADQIAGGR